MENRTIIGRCNNCGAKVNPQYWYCPICGAKVERREFAESATKPRTNESPHNEGNVIEPINIGKILLGIVTAILIVMVWVYFVKKYVKIPVIQSTTQAETMTEEPPNEEEVINVTLYCGETALAVDFLFPHSSSQYLTEDDLNSLYDDDLQVRKHRVQLAINEIFARYGFTFSGKSDTAKEARTRFEGTSWYKAAQAACPARKQEDLMADYFNEYENANINALVAWQEENIPDEE